MSKCSMKLLLGQENMKKRVRKKLKKCELLELGSCLYYVKTTGWKFQEKCIQTSLMLYLTGVDSNALHTVAIQ